MKLGVVIDVIMGIVKKDFLCFEEVVCLGVKLIVEVELNLFDNLSEINKKVIVGILVSGVKLIERLGGKCCWGNGCCELKFSGYFD